MMWTCPNGLVSWFNGIRPDASGAVLGLLVRMRRHGRLVWRGCWAALILVSAVYAGCRCGDRSAGEPAVYLVDLCVGISPSRCPGSQLLVLLGFRRDSWLPLLGWLLSLSARSTGPPFLEARVGASPLTG